MAFEPEMKPLSRRIEELERLTCYRNQEFFMAEAYSDEEADAKVNELRIHHPDAQILVIQIHKGRDAAPKPP